MADYSAYPGSLDVQVLLQSIGAWPTSTAQQARAVEQATIGADAAQSQWEQMTGWRPFLAPSTDVPQTTRAFDGNDYRGVVDLRAAAQTVSSVSWIGRSYTANTDYWLLDQTGNLAYEPPYTGLRIQGRLCYSTLPGQLTVTARWGYCVTIPPLAWKAILQAAALFTLTGVQTVDHVKSLEMDGFKKEWATDRAVEQKDLIGDWSDGFAQAAVSYMRVVC